MITNFADFGIYNEIDSGGNPTIDYNDVWNNGLSAADNYSDVTEGANDISLNPLYVGSGDYHLQAASPCVDAIPTNVGDTIPEDLEGTVRPQVDGYDMGCYESTQAGPTQVTLTVNTSGSGSVTLSPAGGTYDVNTVVTLTVFSATSMSAVAPPPSLVITGASLTAEMVPLTVAVSVRLPSLIV